MVLHTWDQRLRPHFHVHALVPAGALCDQRTRWTAGGRKFLFPVKALSKVFRAKYLDGLKELIAEEQVDVPDSCQSMLIAIQNGSTRRLSKHFKGPWVVYAQKPFAGPARWPTISVATFIARRSQTTEFLASTVTKFDFRIEIAPTETVAKWSRSAGLSSWDASCSTFSPNV